MPPIPSSASRSAPADMSAIDYDAIEDWAPSLAAALGAHISSSIEVALKAARPEFVEDARRCLFDLADREALIDATLEWIRLNTILAYHGSRLTEQELSTVRSRGLVPLRTAERQCRITRALSSHRNWAAISRQLDATLEKYGPGNAAGHREGEVHLTLSKAGLVNGFNHYLTHGAEVDQHVAHALLGEEGVELLACDGVPVLIRVAVPGSDALEATHSIWSLESMRAANEVPNLVRHFLEAWSYRLAHPDFQSSELETDCGLRFRTAILPAWIVDVELLENEK